MADQGDRPWSDEERNAFLAKLASKKAKKQSKQAKKRSRGHAFHAAVPMLCPGEDYGKVNADMEKNFVKNAGKNARKAAIKEAEAKEQDKKTSAPPMTSSCLFPVLRSLMGLPLS